MDEGSYVLALKIYRFTREKANKQGTMDQIDLSYLIGLMEGLLIKNGYEGEPKKFTVNDLNPFKKDN